MHADQKTKIRVNPRVSASHFPQQETSSAMLKSCKIFLASSSELKADRDAFRIFLSVENDRLYKEGFYLELVQWEYFLDAMSDTRLQDEYNKALQTCDIVVSLFFTKAGKYTQEEFEAALQRFKATGKPKLYTYFKDGPVNMGEINDQVLTLLNFKKRLQELGHFPTMYKNIEDLKYQFKLQLERLLPTLAPTLPATGPAIQQTHSGQGDNVAGDQTKIGRQINQGNNSTYNENVQEG
jgi:hypothetical protein